MIMVDWLLLQNPCKKFSRERPALPEQNYPGLGLLNDLIPAVLEAARESGRAGVLDVPEHYHGALFYSRWFHFLEPEMEGKFLAMRRDLEGTPLHIVSRCIYLDSLKNLSSGRYEGWVPGEQILPVSEPMQQYFRHQQYAEIRDRALRENRYQLDQKRCEQNLKQEVVAEDIE